jgi:hypothetical protein
MFSDDALHFSLTYQTYLHFKAVEVLIFKVVALDFMYGAQA